MSNPSIPSSLNKPGLLGSTEYNNSSNDFANNLALTLEDQRRFEEEAKRVGVIYQKHAEEHIRVDSNNDTEAPDCGD